MGKISKIEKSRKEYKCSECGKLIPIGSSYLKGILNFSKPIIRCLNCGLESWEVTTSEYKLQIGRIVNKWQKDYEISEEGLQSIIQDLYDVLSDIECKYDDIPENLQESPTGELLNDRMDGLQNCINELENISYEELVDEEIGNISDDEINDLIEENDISFNNNFEELPDDIQEKIINEANNNLEEMINDALSNLEY